VLLLAADYGANPFHLPRAQCWFVHCERPLCNHRETSEVKINKFKLKEESRSLIRPSIHYGPSGFQHWEWGLNFLCSALCLSSVADGQRTKFLVLCSQIQPLRWSIFLAAPVNLLFGLLTTNKTFYARRCEVFCVLDGNCSSFGTSLIHSSGSRVSLIYSSGSRVNQRHHLEDWISELQKDDQFSSVHHGRVG
jgi:hypothetical protein